ncbi:Uncharacterized protein Adt_18548 [Abeliophyllum distichum]|uniref:Uncharacterized protein n=1 Tax=Abeliophyllum distichum TaxID=126358 RepID=A0ABD1TK18_9LAMI
MSDPITFIPIDVAGVYFSHNDALVVRAVVARNGLGRMLVDDRSFVNIIYREMYDKLGIEVLVIPAIDLIYKFTGDYHFHRNYCLDDRNRRGTNNHKGSHGVLSSRNFFSYHGVLRRPTLIDLGAIAHTKFLYINFLKDRVITTLRRNQFESKACCTNAMRKFVDWKVNVIDVEMKEAPSDPKRLDDGPKEEDEQMKKHEDLEDLDL